MEITEPLKNETMSVGDWVLTLIITAIPLIGIIMLFVWSFGGNTPKVKSNWAKATLIIALIAIVLSFIFAGIIGSVFMGMFGTDGLTTPEY